MSLIEQMLTVALCAAATILTRALPFAVFSQSRPAPRFVQYLGRALPGAVFGLLVAYCFKTVCPFSGSHGVPEALASAVTVAIHLWKRKMLLSIAAGTLCYMVLVQCLGL